MAWEVEGTDQFADWYGSLDPEDQAQLRRPAADTVNGSQFANMKELRINTPPIRVFFAFDPRRVAILLVAGDKTNDPLFYDRMIPFADQLFAEHLAELEAERGD
jgi:hypothetical protein